MACDAKTKQKAFKLFCLGKSMIEISKVDGMPSPTTLVKWKAQQNWEERKQKIDNKTSEKFDEKVVDFKVNMINEINSLKQKLLVEFDNCQNPTKDKLADSLVKLQQQELLLRGEATDHKKIDAKVDCSIIITGEVEEWAK
jgi:hypothetical protein